MSAPDGFFINDMIVLGSPPQSVSMGAFIQAPDLYNSSDSIKTEWTDCIRRFIRGLGLHTSLQTHLDVNHDFQADLDRYAQDTSNCKPDAGTLLRDQLYIEYSKEVANRTARRLHSRIYLCKKITERPPELFSAQERVDWWAKILEEKKREFLNSYQAFNNSLSRLGASVIPMVDQDHKDHYTEFYNPSLVDNTKFNKTIEPMVSILKQTLRSGIQTGAKHSPPYGFYQDGHYHNLLAVTRPPRELESGMFKHLSNLDCRDFRIVSLIMPIDPKKFVKEKQLEINRNKDTYLKQGDEASDTAIGLKKRIIRDITNGLMPYNWLCIIHVWAKTLPALTTKTQQVKDALLDWDDADYYVPTLSKTSHNLWGMIQPGWAFGGYTAHAVYMNDLMMAKAFTVDSAFEGDLKDAWAIFKNHNKGFVGIAPFKGNTPLHTCLIGMSGAGKSELLKSIIRQSLPKLNYLALIDEGFSHEETARLWGTKSKVIHPNTRLCFNTFDTQSLPLSSTNLEATTTLLTRMFGHLQDENEKFIIKSYISEYVVRAYNSLYRQRTKYNSDLNFDLAKEAYVTHLYENILIEQGEEDPNFIDAWTALRDLKDSNPDILNSLAEKATEEKVVAFMKSQETSHYVRDIFVSRLTKSEYPTLSALVEAMSFPMDNHDPKRLELIITILRTWCKGIGTKGGLFDGEMNLPPDDKISIWELSKLGDGESELKQMIGFQITNYERNKIMNLPRTMRKMFGIEEGARFLGVTGSEKFTEELWAQMRKYACWALFTVQQYQQFARTSIAPVVLGNSKTMILMRQNDIQDVLDLCKRVPSIPEPAREAILKYPMPENNNNSASWFTYYRMDSIKPVCGTVKYQKIKMPESAKQEEVK